jgi:hypothetical protein
MTNLRTFALAAAFLGSISLPALAQGTNIGGSNVAVPAAKPVATLAPAKGAAVNAPLHRVAGAPEAAKPGTAAKPALAKPAATTTTTTGTAGTTGTTGTVGIKPVPKTN